MAPLDLFFHLLSFLAPALAVGGGLAALSRLVQARQDAARPWWVQGAINSIACGGILLAGLWYFGVDGKMATYAGVAVAAATSQWLGTRSWKR